jgi:hypothetical protein
LFLNYYGLGVMAESVNEENTDLENLKKSLSSIFEIFQNYYPELTFAFIENAASSHRFGHEMAAVLTAQTPVGRARFHIEKSRVTGDFIVSEAGAKNSGQSSRVIHVKKESAGRPEAWRVDLYRAINDPGLRSFMTVLTHSKGPEDRLRAVAVIFHSAIGYLITTGVDMRDIIEAVVISRPHRDRATGAVEEIHARPEASPNRDPL